MSNEKQHIIEELQNLKAKQLSKLKQNEHDQVWLALDQLNQAVFTEVNRKPKSFSLRKWILPLATAASVVLLWGMFFSIENSSTNWGNISATTLENYINENISEFEDEEIAGIFSFSDESIFINSKWEAKDLEEYLLDNYFTTEELF